MTEQEILKWNETHAVTIKGVTYPPKTIKLVNEILKKGQR